MRTVVVKSKLTIALDLPSALNTGVCEGVTELNEPLLTDRMLPGTINVADSGVVLLGSTRAIAELLLFSILNNRLSLSEILDVITLGLSAEVKLSTRLLGSARKFPSDKNIDVGEVNCDTTRGSADIINVVEVSPNPGAPPSSRDRTGADVGPGGTLVEIHSHGCLTTNPLGQTMINL